MMCFTAVMYVHNDGACLLYDYINVLYVSLQSCMCTMMELACSMITSMYCMFHCSHVCAQWWSLLALWLHQCLVCFTVVMYVHNDGACLLYDYINVLLNVINVLMYYCVSLQSCTCTMKELALWYSLLFASTFVPVLSISWWNSQIISKLYQVHLM